MRAYSVRYVHKIAPRDTDVGDDVTLTDADLVDNKTIGAALRERGTLLAGVRVREWRIEPDGKIVVFPVYPGLTTYWHSVILTPHWK
jgi:hypothetical protein